MNTKMFKEFLEGIEQVFPDTNIGILISIRDIYYIVDLQGVPTAWFDLLIGYDPEKHFLYIAPGEVISC